MPLLSIAVLVIRRKNKLVSWGLRWVLPQSVVLDSSRDGSHLPARIMTCFQNAGATWCMCNSHSKFPF
eukprot:6204142-Amphidinium_carterae.1